MKYLNLTEGFNPYNTEERDCIQFESFFFSGGEPHIKLDMSCFEDAVQDVFVTTRLNSMNDLMKLVVASEALYACGHTSNMYLFAPYLSGSRQDRRMVEGEPLTSKVVASIINMCSFSWVKSFDNHSDVITSLINANENINNHTFVKKCLENVSKDFYIVSPDAGANKKSTNLIGDIFREGSSNCYGLIKCDKTRNVKTGEITGVDVYNNDLKGLDCVMVDDILDGGKTFIETAKALKKKNAGDIYLIVSHGIFSKPLSNLKPYIKKIYTTDSWRSEFNWEREERDCTDLVEIVEFKDFM